MPILSIAVITMNREEQLRDALNSCLMCKLFSDTQFVIIDNASTDSTDIVVKDVFSNSTYSLYYEKMQNNLGVGGGRNYAYNKSNGEYVYFLDDDAIIDYKNNPDFFIDAIKIFEKNPKIATLTSQIYDKSWNSNRINIAGKMVYTGVYLCKSFCGGSHFLRKKFFEKDPYLSNKYGCEELLPSLKVFNEGYYNVFCPDLLVFHCPKTDKWNFKNSNNYNIVIKECSIPYAIKLMMYPRISYLFLFLAYSRRCKKYLKHIPDGKKKADDMVKDILIKYHIDYRISINTLIFMFRNFKLSIF